jgi:UDP-4-amino-4,6-dideoxy-N-acetyl-beta-L-altrosamine transaminase
MQSKADSSPPFIGYGKQAIGEEEIEAVTAVLRSDALTQGAKVGEFERAICDYTSAKYCLAVSSGTAALHLAVAALSLEADVGIAGITSPLTFMATSNSLLYSGLTPQFCDIDESTLLIDPMKLAEQLTPETQVILPVHLSGQSCDMQAIQKIASAHASKAGSRVWIIEDAAHAIGSHHADGTKVGACRYSDMTIFSFHPVKTITTGEGGAITTNDKTLYEKLLLLRNHGIERNPENMLDYQGVWYHEMQHLGFNYRLTDIQAALGIVQLSKLDNFVARRAELAAAYQQALRDISYLGLPSIGELTKTCWHLYVLQIDFAKLGKSRQQVMNELKAKGIGSQVHYFPVHLQPYYGDNFGFKSGDMPVAEAYYEKALSIPLYPAMTGDDQKRVIDALCSL